MRSGYDVNLNTRIGCPAGFGKVHVAPYGDVTGCSMMPVSFGNVREESLPAIVARMRKFKPFAERSSTCIVAVDDEFIQEYVDHSIGYESTPYPVEENAHYFHV